MREIGLIQYMRPDGRKMTVMASVEDQVAGMAEGMILSCEVLTTGEVAIYARYPRDEEEDESLELSPNGPEVQEALQRLIERRYLMKHK
ncbi:MAG: hypothetical protein IMZ43_12295 [Thermoplasmata archaeon]|nr:hypothetical protein [Thermoplasmata archaeon]